LLATIGRALAVFKHQGSSLTDDLMLLGESIIAEMDDGPTTSIVRDIFMDEDFKNRTVLNIIVNNGYHHLCSDSKVAKLIDELWVGVLTYGCDGKINNFSKLSYMSDSPLKNLPK
jgi:hypothetical protein